MNEIKLLKHQKEVLEETKDKNKVAYYLDMGLGKTFIGSEKLKALAAPYNLVVCQKSKLEDWYKHFKIFYKNYNTVIYDKPIKIQPNSVVIINYELLWRRPELNKLDNFTLMLDESSKIKNSSAKITRFILKMKPINVILLSGTPTGGKYEELYSQVKLLGWKISKKAYWDTYIKFINLDVGGFKIPKVLGYKEVDRLKKKLRDHGAVFMKTEEVLDLPNQIEEVVRVKAILGYKKFNKDRIITIGTRELIGDTSLTRLLYLRQLAGLYNSNKTAKLKDILESTDDRVIIFYNFTEEMEKINFICEHLNKSTSIVNGDTRDLDAYENDDNSVTMIQYQAGSMGLNLQKANKIIYFSPTLSSELFEQSKKRIHRIGQEKTCFYYYLVSENTVEEEIYSTLKERRDYTNALFERSN